MIRHPAKFTSTILEAIAEHPLLPETGILLDVFAGVGGIHKLATPQRKTVGVEIEKEWSDAHPDTIHGDATNLPKEWTEKFDSIISSPVYGSRLSDHHNAKDSSKRITYTHVLRDETGDPTRTLAPNNAGQMYSTQQCYWELHEKAWKEVYRVLRSGGVFFLNCSNYIRKGQVEEVVQKHSDLILTLGFEIVDRFEVETPRMKFGANSGARADTEWVLVFRKKEG